MDWGLVGKLHAVAASRQISRSHLPNIAIVSYAPNTPENNRGQYSLRIIFSMQLASGKTDMALSTGMVQPWGVMCLV